MSSRHYNTVDMYMYIYMYMNLIKIRRQTLGRGSQIPNKKRSINIRKLITEIQLKQNKLFINGK